jgi:HEAT repeat protein
MSAIRRRGLALFGFAWLAAASVARGDDPARATAYGSASSSRGRTTRTTDGSGTSAASGAADQDVRKEVERLRAQLAEPSQERKASAATALIALGEPALPCIVEIYQSSLGTEAVWLTWVLRDIGGDAAIDALVHKADVPQPDLQATILESLSRFDDPRGLAVAAKLAATGRGDVKRSAFLLLEKSTDPATTPVFVKGLADSDTWVRESSERALRNAIQRGESLFVAIAEPLPRASDQVAESIVRLLAMTRDPRAPSRIESALTRDRMETRVAALHALVWAGDARVADSIQPLLDDAEPIVRRESIRALAKLGAHGTTPAIIGKLRDSDEDVRVAAHDGLATLTGQDLGMDVAAWLRWWSKADR